MSERTDITVLLAAGGPRREELASTLPSRVLLLGDEPALDRAIDTAADLVPDVVVLDDHDDRAAAGQACLAMGLRTPATRIVALASADDELAYEMLLLGAFSMLSSDASGVDVLAAVRGAPRGECVVTAGAARRLLADARRPARAEREPTLPRLRLTETEFEVLARRAEGMTPDEIATRHDVTPRLVNLHLGYAVAKVHHHLHRVRARDAVALQRGH